MPPSDLAALRGEPSYVWRAGQERRLQMIAAWATLDDARVLDAGCGVGMYTVEVHRALHAPRRGHRIRVRARPRSADRPRRTPSSPPTSICRIRADYFDTILSHETLEHVADDRASARELVRVLKPGGRLVIFVPNRWYFFETHGHYWRGEYHFGNTPLINYLPDVWRNELAPHVRAYTERGLLRLFDGLPVRVVTHQRIYGATTT